MNKEHWRCRWFGHKFQGRWSVAEQVSFSPATKEIARRTDLESLITSSKLMIMTDLEQRKAVEAVTVGAVVAETSTYHGDICSVCGELRNTQPEADEKSSN